MKKAILLLMIISIANTTCWGQNPSDLRNELLRQYEGEWISIDPNTQNLTKIIIKTTGNPTVQAFGSCLPKDCDIGTTELYLISDNVDKNANVIPFDHALAIWDMDFAKKIMKLRVNTGHRPELTQLNVENITIFKDNSGRSNYHLFTIMKKVN